ncbi:hypothetical protein HY439_02755 [Candidatus Microgenomates bacterium]|nr:hypothetical protein [Candidatus Microgenomates bacterium]
MSASERGKHFLTKVNDAYTQLNARAELLMWKIQDAVEYPLGELSELKHALTFPLLLKRGLKKNLSILDCQPEERWGNQALRDTEKWLLDKKATPGAAIMIPLGAWLLNSRYLKPELGSSFPIGIMGRQDTHEALEVVYFYPCLISFNPNQLAEIGQRFEEELKPRSSSTNVKFSVSPLFVGEKMIRLSFADEFKKRAEKEGFEFLGIYEQNLLAELNTICKPGYATKITNHPGLRGFVQSLIHQGEKVSGDEIIERLILSSWMPKTKRK